MLFLERLPGFSNRVLKSAASLILPGGLFVPKNQNVLFVLENEGGKFLHATHNIVTTAGDVWYAQKACGESPTNTFANLKLSTVDWGSTPDKTTDSGDIASQISGSSKAVSATYPKTADSDTDNSGAGTDVVSWLFSYSKADFNDASIDAGAIAASGTTLGTGTDPLLTAFDLTAFAKTANDTLKVFVNHAMEGV